jgi:hypothetical protein
LTSEDQSILSGNGCLQGRFSCNDSGDETIKCVLLRGPSLSVCINLSSKSSENGTR